MRRRAVVVLGSLVASCLVAGLPAGCSFGEPELILVDTTEIEPATSDDPSNQPPANRGALSDDRELLTAAEVAEIIGFPVETAVVSGTPGTNFQIAYINPTGRSITEIEVQISASAQEAFEPHRKFSGATPVEKIGREALWVPVLDYLVVVDDTYYLVVKNVQSENDTAKEKSIALGTLAVERLKAVLTKRNGSG